MKKLIILGNWKANKTIDEAQNWIESFSDVQIPEQLTIIICPAYHHIPLFSEAKFPISLGVQDLSPFDNGAYTGEISAAMLPKSVKFALLGHSERRKHFGESDELISQKVQQARTHDIRPIVCLSDIKQAQKLKDLIPDFAQTGIILYEPLFAIGSGSADTPQNANTVASQMSAILGEVPIIYGGSVVPDNVSGFTGQEYLHGVGVGGASLDPITFTALITNAR